MLLHYPATYISHVCSFHFVLVTLQQTLSPGSSQNRTRPLQKQFTVLNIRRRRCSLYGYIFFLYCTVFELWHHFRSSLTLRPWSLVVTLTPPSPCMLKKDKNEGKECKFLMCNNYNDDFLCSLTHTHTHTMGVK